jgi:hypothetical protein
MAVSWLLVTFSGSSAAQAPKDRSLATFATPFHPYTETRLELRPCFGPYTILVTFPHNFLGLLTLFSAIKQSLSRSHTFSTSPCQAQCDHNPHRKQVQSAEKRTQDLPRSYAYHSQTSRNMTRENPIGCLSKGQLNHHLDSADITVSKYEKEQHGNNKGCSLLGYSPC